MEQPFLDGAATLPSFLLPPILAAVCLLSSFFSASAVCLRVRAAAFFLRAFSSVARRREARSFSSFARAAFRSAACRWRLKERVGGCVGMCACIHTYYVYVFIYIYVSVSVSISVSIPTSTSTCISISIRTPATGHPALAAAKSAGPPLFRPKPCTLNLKP